MNILERVGHKVYRNVLECYLSAMRRVKRGQTEHRIKKCRLAKSSRTERMLGMESLEVRSLMAGQVFEQIPVELTNLEQLSLELVNRARANPPAEATRFGIGLNDGLASQNFITASPKQPLAPDSRLALAARRHSQDMIDRDYFAHDAKAPAPNGITLADRATSVGFGSDVAENIAYVSTDGRSTLDSVLELHSNLFKSVTGHRSNMLADKFDAVGIGVVAGAFTDPPLDGGQTFAALFKTEVFGNSDSNDHVFHAGSITGVVFRDDLIDDDFYSLGEGVPGIGIEARSASGDVYATVTGASGGYRLNVPSGTYTVVSRTGDRIFGLGTATIVDKNVKLDLMTDRIPAQDNFDFDANRDGLVSYLDALVVINFLNLNTSDSSLSPANRNAFDVNKNSIIDPLDVLLLINQLNRQNGSGTGEGEEESPAKPSPNQLPYQTFDASADVLSMVDLESIGIERKKAWC